MKFYNDQIHPHYNHEQWIEKRTKDDTPLNELPTIPEFFTNREIFVTGGTGFIGKALIEKLLRECPDIKIIYLLIRPKKGVDIQERLKTTFSTILFDVLKVRNPNYLEKLVAIPGDVALPGLGLSEFDKKRLKNVSVIFHSAASVRFDDPIQHAVFMNTRGTRDLLELCTTFTDVKAFMHISTAYSNCHMSIIEEKIYPPLADWREVIEICEKINEKEYLDIITRHFTNFMPNTYTFTKHLAENVVIDYKEKLPVVILRPSIVMNAIDDPLCGYIDNFNGPVGLLCGIATGMMKSLYSDPKNVMDMVSLDIVVRATIIGAWKRSGDKPGSLPIYNAAFASKIKFNLVNMVAIIFNGIYEDFPLGKKMLFTPHCTMSLCKFRIKMIWFFYQFMPALILDFFTSNKLGMMRLQRKIYEASAAICFFITHDWQIKVDQFDLLSTFLKRDDLLAFDIRHYENYSPILCGRNWMYGLRKYLMNMKDEDLEKDKIHYKRMEKAAFLIKCMFYAAILYFIWRQFRDYLCLF